MKRSLYRLGAITISLLSWAVLFKVLHWPGGNILLLVTLGGFIPVTSFLVAMFFGKEKVEEKEA